LWNFWEQTWEINNELQKLQIILPKGRITPKDIEENIGFSKDFNVFELRKAIGERNQLKPTPLPKISRTIRKKILWWLLLGFFFIQLLKYHGLKDRNPKNVAAVIGVNPYFLKEYDVALKIIP
jgi:DNA polymerase-3 subunit delta